MAQQEYAVKFRVEGHRSLRTKLATVLVALVSTLLKARVRVTLDTHAPSRKAEVEANRRIMYRGTPMETEATDRPYLGTSPIKPLFEVWATKAECEKAQADLFEKTRWRRCVSCYADLFAQETCRIEGKPGIYCPGCAASGTYPIRPTTKPATNCDGCSKPALGKLAQVGGKRLCGYCAIRTPSEAV